MHHDCQLYIIVILTLKAPRPNKKISVFWITGLKVLGRLCRVGTYYFLLIFFFLTVMPLKMHKNIFFSIKLGRFACFARVLIKNSVSEPKIINYLTFNLLQGKYVCWPK